MPNQLNIHGQGGQFPCFWLDNSAGQPWSNIANYNFNPTPSFSGWASQTTGSYALSERLQVAAGQQVNVAVLLTTAHVEPYWDFGFALLVQGTNVVDVLFALRPDGINQIGDMGPTNPLAAPGPGVTVSTTEKDATGIVLNGVDYGSSQNVGDPDKSIYLSSKCKPPAGAYQILFGIFTTSVTPGKPAAMVVPFFNVTNG